MSDTLIVERVGAVLRLRLNRPAVLNALNQDMVDALLAACAAASWPAATSPCSRARAPPPASTA